MIPLFSIVALGASTISADAVVSCVCIVDAHSKTHATSKANQRTWDDRPSATFANGEFGVPKSLLHPYKHKHPLSRHKAYPISNEVTHMHLLLVWLVSALGLLLAAYVLPGIDVEDFGSALIAAIIIGLLNATLGFLLRLIVFPLTWLLPNLIFLLVDALMILIVGKLMRTFRVKNYLNALLAALILMIVHIVLA